MKSIMRSLLPALAIQLLLALSSAADKYTAPIDYGFGPLTISIDTEGEILTRCEKVDITLGGGFGPYKLGEHNCTRIKSLGNCRGDIEIILMNPFSSAYSLWLCLVSVNAKNKSMPIKLKTDKTAVWEAAVSEGSHVAFNVT